MTHLYLCTLTGISARPYVPSGGMLFFSYTFPLPKVSNTKAITLEAVQFEEGSHPIGPLH